MGLAVKLMRGAACQRNSNLVQEVICEGRAHQCQESYLQGIDGLQDKQRSQPGRFFVAPSSIAGLGLFAAGRLCMSKLPTP